MNTFAPGPAPTAPSPSPAPAAGVVRLSGRDARGLLHNISTQQMLDLAPGQARLALFCDFRGRLLHRVVAAFTLTENVVPFRRAA